MGGIFSGTGSGCTGWAGMGCSVTGSSKIRSLGGSGVWTVGLGCSDLGVSFAAFGAAANSSGSA